MEWVRAVVQYEVATGLASVLGQAPAEGKVETVVQYGGGPRQLPVGGVRGRLRGDEAITPGPGSSRDSTQVASPILEVIGVFVEIVETGDLVDRIAHVADELELLRKLVAVDLVDRV